MKGPQPADQSREKLPALGTAEGDAALPKLLLGSGRAELTAGTIMALQR